MKGVLAAIALSSLAWTFLPASASSAGDGPFSSDQECSAIRIYVNDSPFLGDRFQRHPGNPAGRVRHADSYCSLYVAQASPGSYSLGLILRDPGQKVSVSLFDRWPYSRGARNVKLPSGPVVMTNRKKVEYKWRIGISPESTSPLLYILVETRVTGTGKKRWPHIIYLESPPAVPSSSVGAGITYLQGPENLLLGPAPEEPGEEKTAEDRQDGASQPPGWKIPGDMVNNGSFAKGLNGWIPHEGYETTDDTSFFSLRKEGLVISSTNDSGRKGLMQRIDADVSDAGRLVLTADVKVNVQTLGGTGEDGRQAPIAVAVCYEDGGGRSHCGKEAFWRGFYILQPPAGGTAMDGQKVPEGLWYRFTTDLTELRPRPKYLHYLSLEGSGWPAREGVIREVHMIKRSRK